ncbi:MAG TPA: alpha/beta fold hydrolase [Gammaproteobacteria bacterium]|jgi:pimeloyl-ACP methyl ester carboxylesterase|nr:alpha/beta fold hydrolase [Gammaproteobacteria bacterium]
MAITVSRRSVLKASCAVGAAAAGAGIVATNADAQTRSADAPTDRFFRDDFFGEPWRTPQAVVLIHGALESGIVWYGWMPALTKEFRVLRPDLPGCGLSTVPAGFKWTFAGLAAYVASVLDKAGVESAHIVGAKTGGPIAMQFAADFPGRTRTLSVVSGPASVISIMNPSPVPQQDRLGSFASAEMIEYWTRMEKNAPPAGTQGLNAALSSFDLERDGVLQRIRAPSLVITADRSALQSVEKVRKYQQAIRDSRLVVVRSDAYHIAVAKPDECVASVLAFIRENA